MSDDTTRVIVARGSKGVKFTFAATLLAEIVLSNFSTSYRKILNRYRLPIDLDLGLDVTLKTGRVKKTLFVDVLKLNGK